MGPGKVQGLGFRASLGFRVLGAVSETHNSHNICKALNVLLALVEGGNGNAGCIETSTTGGIEIGGSGTSRWGLGNGFTHRPLSSSCWGLPYRI